MFANKYEDLPICQRVGDIIRVHRVSAGLFKDQLQITANIFFNSSWVLFPGNIDPKAPKKIQITPD
jgi:hypothetical protein